VAEVKLSLHLNNLGLTEHQIQLRGTEGEYQKFQTNIYFSQAVPIQFLKGISKPTIWCKLETYRPILEINLHYRWDLEGVGGKTRQYLKLLKGGNVPPIWILL